MYELVLGTEKMQKVRIIALDEVKYELISRSHDLGVIDIRKSGLALSDDRALDQFPEISTRLIKFESALALLKEPKKEVRHISFERHVELEQILHKCDNLHVVAEIFALNEERKKLQEGMKPIEEALNTARLFEGVEIDFGKLRSNALAFRAFITDKRGANALRSRAEQRGIRNEI